MKIAIIGSGALGSALAHAWGEKHEVVLGVRDPSDAKSRAAGQETHCAVMTASEAVDRSAVIVLAVPFGAAESTLATVSLQLDEKIVIDATNPLTQDASQLLLGFDDSAGESMARLVPNAKVVKAFNTTGSANVRDPKYPRISDHLRLMMPYAGDDASAKAIVKQLIEDAGFEPIDAGRMESARLLEPLAMLWISLAIRQGLGEDFGLALIRRQEP